MKPTAYEYTHKHIQPGWARATELATKLGGPIPALRFATVQMLDAAAQGVRTDSDFIATLPYVMALKVIRDLKDPTDWWEFAHHPEVGDFLDVEQHIGGAAFKQSLVEDWSSATARHLWHYSLHELTGKRVYELSHGLATKLMNTELRGLTTDDLRLPFNSIYVVVPDQAEIKIHNELTGYHDLGGFYITEAVHNGERLWMLLFWAPPNANSTSEYDDALFHFTVKLPAGVPLDEALMLNEKNTSGNAATAHSEEFYKTHWRKLFELAMNTVFYVTWPDAELKDTENPRYAKVLERVKKHPKGSHKREVASQELKDTPQQRRIVLGPSVRALEAPTGEGTPLTVRTKVSGHWKRQFHGEGRALRKWIFIEPYWKGPEDGPESNPRRVLESP